MFSRKFQPNRVLMVWTPGVASAADSRTPDVVLPDQSSVDATSIDRPVTTKHGFVVPHGASRFH